jgi:dUTP pyrophosphatase
VYIKFERCSNNDFDLPQYKTEGAAAFDLKACLTRMALITGNGPNREEIPPNKDGILDLMPGDIIAIPTGWKVEFPFNCVLILAVRSSIGAQGLTLANSIGVIDSDYRGELFVALHNTRDDRMTITHGERIAQAMLLPVLSPRITEEKVGQTQRGEGGLGSTGKFDEPAQK